MFSAVAREWCLVVRPRYEATEDELSLIDLVFEMQEPPFDWERDGSDWLVFGDARHSVRRLEKAVLHALAESDVADAVVTPLWCGRLDDDTGGYSFPPWVGEQLEETEPEPVVSPEEIAWAVSVKPVTFFGWPRLREELERLGRTAIDEDEHRIEIGARDQPDAQALLDQLRDAGLIREGDARSLNWFRRWRVRQQLLGNYAAPYDPSQSV